ncbi:MAG: hypothetical protein ACRD00_07970, partial [Thermoanaerobaculia bacterium]
MTIHDIGSSDSVSYIAMELVSGAPLRPRFASGDTTTCNGLWDDDSWYACETPGPATPPAKRVYRGLEVLARQSVGDRSWLQASYVHSSLRGNYEGEGGNGTFNFPALWHNSYGALPLDRPNRFRLDGFWV